MQSMYPAPITAGIAKLPDWLNMEAARPWKTVGGTIDPFMPGVLHIGRCTDVLIDLATPATVGINGLRKAIGNGNPMQGCQLLHSLYSHFFINFYRA